MSSIGARPFSAVCAEALALLAAALSAGAVGRAADCPPRSLTAQEAAARLKELNRAAQSEMQQHNYTQAVQDYREAACLAPDAAPIYYGLGVAQAASGDFLGARKSLGVADRLEPSNVLPLAMLVRVNFSLGDTESLKAALRGAAKRFPQDGNLHAGLARFLVENKLLDLALAESLRAQHASGANAGSVMELAVLENTVGAYEDAVRNAASLERQASLPARLRASAAGVAGLSYESTGRREEAIAHLREAIRLDPSQENSYLALAFLFEKAERYSDAVSILEQGRRQLPGSTALLLPLGSNLVRAEHYRAGIEVLRELLRHSPDEADAYLRIADAYRKTGRPAEEAGILHDLAARKPDYPRIHLLIARALLGADPADYPKVLDELALGEKSAPSDAEIFYLRGRVYLATGRNQEAAAALLRAIELGPMDPAPYYQLGRLYQKLGKTELARELLGRMQYVKNTAAK
jgi:tetratricopeptide (TPR) repeat protein